MRALLLVALLACGGSTKSAAPVSNTEPSPASATPEDGTGRVVTRSKDAGVIELSGDRDKAMAAADAEMAKHCGANNYTIVQEGEEAVRTDVAADGSTQTQTAWRVHYQCAR